MGMGPISDIAGGSSPSGIFPSVGTWGRGRIGEILGLFGIGGRGRGGVACIEKPSGNVLSFGTEGSGDMIGILNFPDASFCCDGKLVLIFFRTGFER